MEKLRDLPFQVIVTDQQKADIEDDSEDGEEVNLEGFDVEI